MNNLQKLFCVTFICNTGFTNLVIWERYGGTSGYHFDTGPTWQSHQWAYRSLDKFK